MAIYRRGKIWWYSFRWRGEEIRESTRQRNKRTAEKIQAAHRTRLAEGQVGIFEQVPAPTLRDFAEDRFLPFVQQTFEAKPNTRTYYEQGLKRLLANAFLADCRLTAITAETIAQHAAAQRDSGLKISSVNRQLQVLRRIFALATEWKATDKALPKVSILPGENRRERVLTAKEEKQYLEATQQIGHSREEKYRNALTGIRATQRGQEPTPPRDPGLLNDLATLLIDCGLRPEEAFRLRREYVTSGVLTVPTGKTINARRKIPMPARAREILEDRLRQHESEWVFPAPTKSGHIEPSTVRDQHTEALQIAKLKPFVLYDLRHTCLTRWSAHMDPYTLAYLAGHSDFATTKRYVHPDKHTVLTAMNRATKHKAEAETTYSFRNSVKITKT